MSRYVLALDQGTTSSRAIVFDRGGRVVSLAQQEFAQIFPSPGHVEHNPEAIWSSQLQTARDFGPRLFTAVAGWGGGVFTAGGGWWWVPVVAPCVGAVAGAFLYDGLVGRHLTAKSPAS